MSQLTTVHDPWAGRQTVPVIEVARAAGLPRYDLRRVEHSGLIEHAGRDGRGGRLMLTHDDALFLLRAALVATAAGIGLVTMVRLLRQAGASLGPDGFVIPLPASP